MKNFLISHFNSRSATRSGNNQSGFTLITLMLSLAVIAILSTAIFGTYKLVNHSAQNHDAVQNVRTLSRTISQTYGQSGTYDGVTSAKLIQNDLAPKNLVKGADLVNAWGGQINVTPQTGTSNEAYQIALTNIPTSACINLSQQLKQEFSSIEVNGSQVASTSYWPDVGTLTNVCAASNSNTLAFNSYPLGSAVTGEVALPPDAGNPAPPPVLPPATNGAVIVAGVTPVTPTIIASPTYAAFAPPVSHAPAPGLTPIGVTNPSGIAPGATPPPPPSSTGGTCVPGSISSAVNTTQTQNQTISCVAAGYPANYTGGVVQQQSRTQTVTTTNVTSCDTPWSDPEMSSSSVTTYSAWGPWSTAPGGDTCIPPLIVTTNVANTATCFMTGDYGTTVPAVNGNPGTSCRQGGTFNWFSWWGAVFNLPAVVADAANYTVSWTGDCLGQTGPTCYTPHVGGTGVNSFAGQAATALVTYIPTGQVTTVSFNAMMNACGFIGGPYCD